MTSGKTKVVCVGLLVARPSFPIEPGRKTPARPVAWLDQARRGETAVAQRDLWDLLGPHLGAAGVAFHDAFWRFHLSPGRGGSTMSRSKVTHRDLSPSSPRPIKHPLTTPRPDYP